MSDATKHEPTRSAIYRDFSDGIRPYPEYAIGDRGLPYLDALRPLWTMLYTAGGDIHDGNRLFDEGHRASNQLTDLTEDLAAMARRAHRMVASLLQGPQWTGRLDHPLYVELRDASNVLHPMAELLELLHEKDPGPGRMSDHDARVSEMLSSIFQQVDDLYRRALAGYPFREDAHEGA